MLHGNGKQMLALLFCPPIAMPSRLWCRHYFLLTWEGLLSRKGGWSGSWPSVRRAPDDQNTGLHRLTPHDILRSNERKDLNYMVVKNYLQNSRLESVTGKKQEM